MEYSMTGRSHSATTSRRMWMLSASSSCRWVSLVMVLEAAPVRLLTSLCGYNAVSLRSRGADCELMCPAVHIPGGSTRSTECYKRGPKFLHGVPGECRQPGGVRPEERLPAGGFGNLSHCHRFRFS